jgi:hypothetical protein
VFPVLSHLREPRGCGTVEDTTAVDSLLEWPGALLEKIVALLGGVGVDLAPLWLQLFLVALVVGLLVPATKRVRTRKKSERLALVAVVALALTALGVLIGLVENATTPRRVAGTVISDRLAELRVTLLDFRGRTVSSGSGLVDTVSGRFALHYNPLVDGRARTLRITAPGCSAQDVDLSRAQLRASTEAQWNHRCIAG